MKIYYDKETDSAYIQLTKKRPDGVVEVSDYINMDTTKSGEIIGIELLNASKNISLESLFNFEIDVKSLTGTGKPIRHLRRSNKTHV